MLSGLPMGKKIEERSDEAIPCRWPFDNDNGMRLPRRPERPGRLAMTRSSASEKV
jgi:hypothetical protein